ncbi:MAG: hypothetical protein ABII79_01035 [bacterium]
MAMRRTSNRTRRTNWPRRTPSRRFARPWVREEIAFMRKYYRNYETAWIARQLGRTVYSIRYKAVDLHIRKSSPSVWRGKKGSPTAFKFTPAKRWTPSRKTAKPRSSRTKRTWKTRSGMTTRTPRRTIRRKR